jgi:hypothetical protein
MCFVSGFHSEFLVLYVSMCLIKHWNNDGCKIIKNAIEHALLHKCLQWEY